MDDISWISWIIGVYSITLLLLILHMKKTDPVFGCEKYKRIGCTHVSGRDCGYPKCTSLEKFRAEE